MTTETKTQKRAVLYARYSSDMQSKKSVEDQMYDCEQYAKRQGYKIVAKYSDRAKSATTMVGRDGFNEMMQRVKRGECDVVVSESWSRLARNAEDSQYIFRRTKFKKIDIDTISDGIADRMKVGFRGIMDEEYIAQLALSVKRGHRGIVRDEGRFPGSNAYGYDLIPHSGGKRVINKEKAKVVSRIFREYAAGKSPRTIAKGLTEDRIPSPSGADRWNFQVLLGGGGIGILSNRIYIGEKVWGRKHYVKDPDTKKVVRISNPESDIIVASVPHLRIIEQPLFDAVQRLRLSRAEKSFGVGGKKVKKSSVVSRVEHLLNGLVRCGKCSGQMIVSNVVARGKNGALREKPRRYVRCANAHRRSSCDHTRTYNIDTIQSAVLENWHASLIDSKVLTEASRSFHSEYAKQAKQSEAERLGGEKQLKKLELQIARITLAITESDEPLPALIEAMKAKEAERARLAERVKILTAPTNVVSLHPNFVTQYKKLIANLHADLAANPGDLDFRASFRNVIDSVVVHPTPVGGSYDIELFGRVAAMLGVEPPKPRSREEIIAAEGLSGCAIASGIGNKDGRYRTEGAVIPLGRLRSKAA